VPDGEYTPMEPVQATCFDPVLNRAAAQPKRQKLSMSNHAMLATGKRGDLAIP
jgi:hypothetical protein